MKIASEKTFQQFDKLKSQLYAHKRQITVKPVQVKSPISIKFRSFLPIILIGGGLWVVYKNSPQLKNFLVENNYLTYQEKLAWSAMEMYFKCKWKSITGANKSYNDKNLANRCYLSKLESDLLYLNIKNPQKKLSIETKSKLSFWIIGLTNQQKIRYVNQHGDLLEKRRSSKFMIGDFIRIWTDSSIRLLNRQQIFSLYQKESNSIGNDCEKVNFVTKLQYPHEQYEQVLKECKKQSEVIKKKIIKLIEERLAKQRKQQIIKY